MPARKKAPVSAELRRIERRIELGRQGEDAAASLLEREGYEILARNVRTRLGEIDIVASDGDTLAIVEVKLRSSIDAALLAVDARKQRRISLLAAALLARPGAWRGPLRFDVVAVERGTLRAVLVRGAFDGADGF
ncbi:MAG: putative endonuclease [Hyphomicrobiaceae bacterium]|jgi:putative endonuclease